MYNFVEKVNYLVSWLNFKWRYKNKLPISSDEIKNTLIIKLDEIGDVVYASHVPEILYNYFQIKTDIWIQPMVKSLFESSPHINDVFIHKPKKKYDLVVDLRPCNKSLNYIFSTSPRFLVERANIRVKNKKNGHPHEVITNREILTQISPTINVNFDPNLFTSKTDQLKINSFVETEIGAQKYAVIHTTARKNLRRWPLSNYKEISSWLYKKYNLKTVVIGVDDDQEYNKTLFSDSNIINGLGFFSLPQTFQLIKQACLYVGNESGPLTLASVSKTPTLGLFGPGEPTTFYPYGKSTSYIHYVLGCNPCSQNKCIKAVPCIELISINEVKSKIEQLLS